MTGWRVGWMIGPADVIKAATNLQTHATSNVANVSQRAAIAALTGDLSAVAEMRAAFDRRGAAHAQAAHRHRGRHRARAAGRVLRLPDVRPYLERPIRGRTARHHARARRAPARRGQGGDRAGRGVRRARATPGCRSPSATTTWARACAASPISSQRPDRVAGSAERAVLPFGSWPTPITSELVVRARAPAQRAPASTATTCGGPRAGPRRRAAPRSLRRAADGTVDRRCSPRRGTPAPACTSTAAARGGPAPALVVRRLGRPAAAPRSRRAPSRSPSRPSPRWPAACATPTATSTRTARRSLCVREEHHADGSEATNTIVRLSADAPLDPRGRRDRSGLRGRPAPAPRRGGLLLARVGPPRHAVGRHSPHRRRGRACAPSWPAATGASRSASPRGRPTARCGSPRTGAASGASTAGRRPAASSRWSTSSSTSGSPSGSSARPASRCSTTAAWPSSSATAAWTSSPCSSSTAPSAEVEADVTAIDQLRATGAGVVAIVASESDRAPRRRGSA